MASETPQRNKELCLFKQEKWDWPGFVSELKDNLYKYAEKSSHIVELDVEKKKKLLPPDYPNQKRFEHNYLVLVELKRHFSECNSAEIDEVDITKTDFAVKLFSKLHIAWNPGDFSAAAAKLDELDIAYKNFVGNPIVYFQRISTLVSILDKMGQKPNVVSVCKSCTDNIYRFANSTKASKADSMWAVWLAAFEREFSMFTLEILSDDMQDEYDTYLRMKLKETATRNAEASDLVNFNTRTGRRRDDGERPDGGIRDERPDGGTPQWNRWRRQSTPDGGRG